MSSSDPSAARVASEDRFLRRLYAHAGLNSSALLRGGSSRLTLTPAGIGLLERRLPVDGRGGRRPEDAGAAGGAEDDGAALSAEEEDELCSLLRALPRLRVEDAPAGGRDADAAAAAAAAAPASAAPGRLDAVFPSLMVLELRHVRSASLLGLAALRGQLQRLVVVGSAPSAEALWRGCLGDGAPAEPRVPWVNLRSAVVQRCGLETLGEVLELLPHVEVLDLCHNALREVEGLERCPRLSCVNLGFNRIQSLELVNLHLGNVQTLVLRQNHISDTGALCKLYSLERLDLSDNLIASMRQVEPLGRLPCLVQVWLSGNPVSFLDGYRVQALVVFRDLLPELKLDGRAPSDRESRAVRKEAARRGLFETDAAAAAGSSAVNTSQLFPSPSRGGTAAAEPSASSPAPVSFAGRPRYERPEPGGSGSGTRRKRRGRRRRRVARIASIGDSGGGGGGGGGVEEEEEEDDEADADEERRARLGGAVPVPVPVPVSSSDAAAGRRAMHTPPPEARGWMPGSVPRDTFAAGAAPSRGPTLPPTLEERAAPAGDYYSQIQALHREGGEKWMTILTEFQNAASPDGGGGGGQRRRRGSDGGSGGSGGSGGRGGTRSRRSLSAGGADTFGTPQRRRPSVHQRTGRHRPAAAAAAFGGPVSQSYNPAGYGATPPPAMVRAGSWNERAAADPRAGSASASAASAAAPEDLAGVDDETMASLLSSFECLAERGGRTCIISVAASSFRELSADTGGVVSSRALDELEDARVGGRPGEVLLRWRAGVGAAGGEDVYMVEDDLAPELLAALGHGPSTTTAPPPRRAAAAVGEEAGFGDGEEEEEEEEAEAEEEGEGPEGSAPPAGAPRIVNKRSSLSMALEAKAAAADAAVAATDGAEEKRRDEGDGAKGGAGITVIQDYYGGAGGEDGGDGSSGGVLGGGDDGGGGGGGGMSLAEQMEQNADEREKQRQRAMSAAVVSDFYRLLRTGQRGLDYVMHAYVGVILLPASGGGSAGEAPPTPQASRPSRRKSEAETFVVLTQGFIYFLRALVPAAALLDAATAAAQSRRRGGAASPRGGAASPPDAAAGGGGAAARRLFMSEEEAPLEVTARYGLADVERAEIGLFFQTLSLRFRGGDEAILLAREKALASRLLGAVTQGRAGMGLGTEVCSSDGEALARLQAEAFGGAEQNIRDYTCLFRPAGEAGGAAPVSVIVTDDHLWICEEDFLERSGRASRYVTVGIEPVEELQQVSVVQNPTASRYGRLRLQFGKRSVFERRMGPKRSVDLLSRSEITLRRMERDLTARVRQLRS